MNRIPLYAIFMLVAALTSCVNPDEVRKQNEAAIPDSMRSYVIGEYVVTCKPHNESCNQQFNSISLVFRNSTGRGSGGVLASTQGSLGQDSVYDFVHPDASEKGYYFCRVLPTGSYAFQTFSYWNFAGGGNGFRIRKENEFNVPFSTTPGEVVYLGRLKLSSASGKNLFGMNLPAPGVLLLSPGNAKEMALALKKCPEIARSLPVRSAELKASMANGNVLVQDNGGN